MPPRNTTCEAPWKYLGISVAPLGRPFEPYGALLDTDDFRVASCRGPTSDANLFVHADEKYAYLRGVLSSADSTSSETHGDLSC